MPNITQLRTEDYMAVTRAMDTNGNHRIDQNEAKINWNTHNKIGNANGVAGTRELANALQSGDVFISGMNPATADKIADYFSKRNENFDRPVAEWVSDAWISKDDFDFDPQVKQLVDTNGDNRISRKEFSAALASGALSIGQSRQVSQDPFQQPNQGRDPFQNPSQGRDPFQQPNQGRDPFQNPNQGRDPFQQPNQGRDPFQNPSQGRDPFQNPDYDRPIPDSGAYLQIDMVKSMRSDYEKAQLLMDLAKKPNLSPREQSLLADAAVNHISSDHSKAQILQTLASNSNLHQEGAVRIAKKVRELSSDYSKAQLIDTLVNRQKLGYQAQESSIITIGTFSSEHSKAQSFLNLIARQSLDPQNKELLVDTVQKNISSDYSKRQILNALF